MFRLFFSSLLLPAPAFAATANLNLPAIGGVAPGSTPASFIAYLFVAATFFVGAVAVIMVVVGGLRYLAAAGRPDAANKGKKQVQDALLGLLIVLGAVLILYTINPDLVRLRDPSLPIVALPVAQAPLLPSVAPGACGLTAAGWSDAQACYDATGNFYPNVSLAVSGTNCEDFTVAFNVINKSSGATVKTLGGTMEAGNASAAWNPADQTPACASPACDGTYYFEVVAGSGTSQTTIRSGDLTIASGGTCITQQKQCYYNPGSCFGFRCADGVTEQIAASEYDPALQSFILCLGRELQASGRSDVGKITAISDNSGGACFNLSAWQSGALTQCPNTCNNSSPVYNGTAQCCAHNQNSCHYGGTDRRGRSYAVDFGTASEPADTCTVLHQAVIRCNNQSGARAWFHDESDHYHISIGAINGASCDTAGACTPGQAGRYVSDWCTGETPLCCDSLGNVTPMPVSGICP